jgi:hypothetical protein
VTISGYGVPYPGDAAGNWFAASDKRLALMSQVTGNKSPTELGAIYAQDKKLSMQEAQYKFQYDYTTAWQDSNLQHRKDEVKKSKARLDAGVLFGY